MPRQPTRRQPYELNAGALGWLEGTTLFGEASSEPLLHYFGGLPYALPPVGQYRFQKARPLPEHYRYGSRSNPGRYTGQSAVCPQPAWRASPDAASWDEEGLLSLNVYIPAGKPPTKGWPVFFFIHGGFLQWGSPNFAPEHIAPLLSESAFEAIIVTPAYRVNVFGFVASSELQAEATALGEPSGNMGFWDQRLALEWTSRNTHVFGGDANNITIGGYSAGSHSVFHQLAHELYFVKDEDAIIKRAIMWSNSPGVQPRTVAEQQKQFNELLAELKISSSLSASDKLKQLRNKSALEIVQANDKIKLSEFRATSDGEFVSKQLIDNINSGDLGRRMKARGIKLMNGECRDEHHLYESWRTPPAQSFDAVYTRLCADYPEQVVKKLTHIACGEQNSLPQGCKNWPDAFGKLYANMQVHCLERGFHKALLSSGLVPGQDLLRYRFDWRAKCVDAFFPPEWGVTHATDMAIWFWGLDYGEGLTDEEKEVLRPWNEAFAAFVKGETVTWGTADVKEMMRLRSDGVTDVWVDDRWDEGIKIWDAVNGDAASGLLGWLRSKF
ncbi:putative carboxylesterase, type B, carboxylesterase type B, active, alpha/Beta hydrolase [Septoria linicola]|nr:putative carboxylesterase, type B, carboxylesterase type B, active, alpha/Beta hydrolase [Septoria linicola]